jgi:hypothetical protein
LRVRAPSGTPVREKNRSTSERFLVWMHIKRHFLGSSSSLLPQVIVAISESKINQLENIPTFSFFDISLDFIAYLDL